MIIHNLDNDYVVEPQNNHICYNVQFTIRYDIFVNVYLSVVILDINPLQDNNTNISTEVS